MSQAVHSRQACCRGAPRCGRGPPLTNTRAGASGGKRRGCDSSASLCSKKRACCCGTMRSTRAPASSPRSWRRAPPARAWACWRRQARPRPSAAARWASLPASRARARRDAQMSRRRARARLMGPTAPGSPAWRPGLGVSAYPFLGCTIAQLGLSVTMEAPWVQDRAAQQAGGGTSGCVEAMRVLVGRAGRQHPAAGHGPRAPLQRGRRRLRSGREHPAAARREPSCTPLRHALL